MKRQAYLSLMICALLLAAAGSAHACTGIRVRPKDGSVITGRTLEFAVAMQSNAIVIPRGKAYTGSAPGGKPGLKWTAKYGVVGTNALGLPQLLDGVNEQGLGVGLFYFPDYAEYQEVTAANTSKALAPWEFGTYLLTTCGSADEAVKAARDVVVGPTVLDAWGFTPPAHFVVHDANGKCFVLEYVRGKLIVYENPLGVMSNSPTFDWHLTNLRNYVNLSVTNVPPVKLSTIKLTPFGAGSGMLGLPGDLTPPARFVRAVAFSQSVLPAATADDGVKQAFHVLNLFDVPKGAVRQQQAGKPLAEYTEWTSVSDLTNRRFYFRTFENQTVRKIDLKRCDLNAKNVVVVPMTGSGEFEDVTPKP